MAEDRLPSFSHCVRRSLWPLWDRRTVWAILALLTLIGGLYLWQASQITAIRYRIGELDEAHERWRRKNTESQKEIAKLTQVTTLSERARTLGFIVPTEEIYLKLPDEDLPASGQGTPHE